MPVSSYVLTTKPNLAAQVATHLRAYENIQSSDASGSLLAVAVSSETEDEARKWGSYLEQLPEVEQCCLVYHNFEDTAQEPVPAK